MKRTIESITPPENKQVLWLDVSSEIKQLKCFINGDWVIVGDDTLNNEEIVQRVLAQVDSDFASYIKKDEADNTYVAKDDVISYQNKLVIGDSSTSLEDTEAGNGNVWLVESSTEKGIASAHNIVGTGSTTVTSDVSGRITIASTDVYPTKLVIDQTTDTTKVPITIELSNGNKIGAAINAVTQEYAGIMTSEEKKKLSAVAESATSDTSLSTAEIENLLK